MIRITELRERDVVNVNDGRRLGLIKDLELDLEKGLVKSIVIPGAGGVWGKISRSKDYVVPWEKIVKIGVDTILVDYPQDDYHRRD